MTVTTRIRTHERGLRFKHGQIVGLLGPGTYRLWSKLWNAKRDRIDVLSTLSQRFNVPEWESFLTVPSVRDALHLVELTETQRALIWIDGRLFGVSAPAVTRSGSSPPRSRSRRSTSAPSGSSTRAWSR